MAVNRIQRQARSLILGCVVLAATACDNPAAPVGTGNVTAIEVLATASPFVREVIVTLREPGGVRVTWGAEGTRVLSLTNSEPATSHRFLISRLRAARSYTVEAEVPGAGRTPMRAGIVTDALVDSLRAIQFIESGMPTEPLALIEVAGATQVRGLLMVEQGELVGHLAMEGSLFGSTRRANGNFVLMDAALGLVEYRIDGAPVSRLPQAGTGTVTPYERIHHDVIATPSNTLLFIATDTRPVLGDTVVGEAIWEWTPETNAVVKRWSAHDLLDWSTLRGSRSVPGNWLHGNGISLGARGNVIMSLRNVDQVISIAPDFGSIEWALGGTTGTLAVADSDRFYGQHYASESGTGRVLVYDNGFDRPGATFTRAIEYAINTTTLAAARVWQYRHTPDIYAALVGSARRHTNGRTTILFGMLAGQNSSTGPVTAVEVDAAGQEVWRLNFGPQLTRIYRLTPVPSLGGEIEGAFSSR